MGVREGLIHIEQYSPRTAEAGSAGGETWIPSYVSGLRIRPGFEHVRSIGFVRDADRGPKAKLLSLRYHLKAAALPVPRSHGAFATRSRPDSMSVGVFIMPDGVSHGALEDLYLAAVEHQSVVARDRALVCVDSFLDCLDPGSRTSSANRAKRRLRAWLTTRADPTILPGQAVTRLALRTDCPPLEPIKAFLRRIADDAAPHEPEALAL
jgi:hypothetical protein